MERLYGPAKTVRWRIPPPTGALRLSRLRSPQPKRPPSSMWQRQTIPSRSRLGSVAEIEGLDDEETGEAVQSLDE